MSKSVQTIEKTSKSIKGLLLFSGAAMIFGLVEAIRYASTNVHIANLAWSMFFVGAFLHILARALRWWENG